MAFFSISLRSLLEGKSFSFDALQFINLSSLQIILLVLYLSAIFCSIDHDAQIMLSLLQ